MTGISKPLYPLWDDPLVEACGELPVKPYVPPGAQEKTLEQQEREARVQAELEQQKRRVQKVMEAKREMTYSPLGLRALFPTNKIKVKIKHKARDGRPSDVRLETPATQLEERANEAGKE